MAPAGFGFCPLVAQVERCDGTNLAGQTCQTSGYGSGTLACSTICTVETRGCSECLPLDSSLLRCGDAPVAAPAIALGIAATDSEVAVAWLELDAASRPVLGFARLSPSLDLASASPLMDVGATRSTEPAVVSVRVAPLVSGWVVAGYYDPTLFFHAVSATGADGGHTTVETLPLGMLWARPVLAPRPDGGPLLVWETTDGIRASVISSDGRSATPPARVATGPSLAGALSAAYVGDAFYVAFSVDAGANPAQLRLVRVGVDGQIGAAVAAPAGLQVEVPKLVSGGDHLRVMYAKPGGETVWQRVSLAGAALGAPVPVELGGAFTGTVSTLAFGSDTVAVIGGTVAKGVLGFVRLAGDGSVVTPPRPIASAPNWAFGIVDAARRGSDLVVLWEPLRLARVVP